MRTGGQTVVDQLALNGITRIFTVPGESFLPVLDALHDAAAISLVVCRHEGAAAMMAEATARLAMWSDRPLPGVALVTRGPGLANAMSGLHAAMQAATPLLLLVGMPPTGRLGREAFQEVAVEPLTGSFAKFAATAATADRLPELVTRALTVSLAGRPGPVVLGLPEDVLAAMTGAGDLPPVTVPVAGPTWIEMGQIGDALAQAEWPLVIAGGAGWTTAARAELTAFAERFDLPVVASFRAQDVIDNRHPCYVGHAGRAMAPKLERALASADTIIAIGTHLDETTTGSYRALPLAPATGRRLIHVHPSPDVIGRVIATDLAIVSSVANFTSRLDDVSPSIRAGTQMRWATLRRDLRASFESWQRFEASPGPLKLEHAIRHMSETLSEDAIVTNGAGNYAAFLHRAFTWKAPATQLAPVSGSMGYGLPAAIAAKLAMPDRDVVCIAGDGCFQMTSAELATAMQYGLALIVIVANNAMLGTIRAEQERRYPGRVVATSLVNPDFVALARSHGAEGERVTTDAAFAEAFERARMANGPFLIELVLDPTAIAPGKTIGNIADTTEEAN